MVQSLAISIPNISTLPRANSNSNIHNHNHGSLDSPSSEATSDSSTFSEIPLTALSKNTRLQLSNALNSRKILRSEEGYERDWRGIASLSKQKTFCDENALSSDDAMTKVLHLWCRNNPKTATFAILERFLGIIDRWDVCDDIYENLAEDAKNYNAQLQQKSLTLNGETDNAALQTTINNNNNINNNNIDNDFGTGSDPNILTKDDVLRAQKGLPPQQYDAFVLFADSDINYAVEMLTKLEDNNEYNFKLCLKDRDLLAGVSFTHVALTQLIEERCKHLIVILTEEFLKSPENKFLVNYTQALQIQNKTRKIIPLIYEDTVVIPRTLKIYTHLKYNTNCSLFNFWGRLAASIRNVNISMESSSSSSMPAYSRDTCSVSSTSTSRQSDSLKSSIANLPTPPSEIPSIIINGCAFVPEDDDVPKQQERIRFKKRSSLRGNNNKLPISNGVALRNAHSTSQLCAGYRDGNASLSDLSTTSGSSDTKKKKKWPSKLFKKVFSRSSSKLQEPA